MCPASGDNPGTTTTHQNLPSEDTLTRILMHGIHEETIFYQRLNFFFLIEALMLGSLLQTGPSQAGPSDHRVPHLVEIVSIVGLLTSVVWLLVQLDKLRLLTTIITVLKEAAPEFAETIRRAKQGSRID